MKKIIGFVFLMMMMSGMSVPAFASTKISDVYITIAPEDASSMSPGEVVPGLEPETSDEGYYIDEYEVSSSDPNPRKSYTYTIELIANSGYYFNSSTDVSVYGAVEVTIKSVTSSTMKIRVKTYPYYVLDNPKNVTIDTDSEKGTWDEVDYAKSYSVVVHYTNSAGNERATKKSVTKNSIDLSGYIGKYDDVWISVRAVRGTSDGDKFISNSDYVGSDGSIDEEYSDDEYSFNIPTAKSDDSTSGSSSSSGTSTSSAGPSSVTNGWSGSGEEWYYYQNGSKVTGWLSLGTEEWYLFDSNGKMLSGWQLVDGTWFYFNTIHDGTFGKMFAGWNYINGAWYYFSEVHDGSYGAMYADRYSPDGRYLSSSGAMAY